MNKRRTDDQVTRLLKDADRDLAKGLTVSDFCRKVGVAQTTYHRWRKRHDPKQVDSDRRCRQLEGEVERLKRLVAELLLDKQMLQDVAKKKATVRQTARMQAILDTCVPVRQAEQVASSWTELSS